MPEINNIKKEQEIIKNAVNADSSEPSFSNSKVSGESSEMEINKDYPGMEQSVMSSDYSPMTQEQSNMPSQEEQPTQEYSYTEQYDPYQPVGISPDTISELAEQVVSEKMGPIANAVEKLIDQKTTTESQIQYLDERLKRIEKIIDRLQLSLLQRVGEYVTNVEDIKKEMVETQKSFKYLLDQKDKL